MESATILTDSFGVNLHLFLQFTDKAILNIAILNIALFILENKNTNCNIIF